MSKWIMAPGAFKNWAFQFSDRLAGATLTAAVVTADAGLTISNITYTDTDVTFWALATAEEPTTVEVYCEYEDSTTLTDTIRKTMFIETQGLDD